MITRDDDILGGITRKITLKRIEFTDNQIRKAMGKT